eukprot:3246371-Pyramimonas_sp.AAC.1
MERRTSCTLAPMPASRLRNTRLISFTRPPTMRWMSSASCCEQQQVGCDVNPPVPSTPARAALAGHPSGPLATSLVRRRLTYSFALPSGRSPTCPSQHPHQISIGCAARVCRSGVLGCARLCSGVLGCARLCSGVSLGCARMCSVVLGFAGCAGNML